MQNILISIEFDSRFASELVKDVLLSIKEEMEYGVDESIWWNGVKLIGEEKGFASSNKDYKANPDAYKGSTSDCAELLRLAITGSRQSPNLHEILEILGKNEVDSRIDTIISSL